MNVAIVGYGFVGKATEYFLNKYTKDSVIQIHDKFQDKVIKDWKDIDFAFICVPTNLNDGRLDISIIDSVIAEIPRDVQIIIRSTIGPDQCLKYARENGAIVMPEFLRERHWQEDVDDMDLPIVVGSSEVNLFNEWIKNTSSPKEIFIVRPQEASMMKMARNAALAMKVALANDFKEMCDSFQEMDYNVLRVFLESDVNLGGTHWAVPGPDNKEGFGGTCLPKDLTHASSLCYNLHNIMNTAVEANKRRRDDG